MLEFKTNPNCPNEILHGEGFYISYNPRTGVGNPLSEVLSGLTGFPHGLAETALCVNPDDSTNRKWYILEGDFRKEYAAVAHEGLEACMKVYQKNILHRSEWSTDEPLKESSTVN